MTDQSADSSVRAKTNVPAIVVGIAAILTGLWGYSESQRADALEASLARTNAALQEASKRDLPVSVSFRSPLFGSGLVATFRNNSSRTLEVAAVFSSPNTGQQKQANLVIPSDGIQEIASDAGWAFAGGQRISLTNTEFRPIAYVVPGS